jgi:hypothetical protein
MNYIYLYAIVWIGIGATLFTDLWNLFLKRVFNIQSLNFCFLGRWILHMPNGKFRHDNIKATPPKSMECVIGWIAHYSIGIVLTLFFIILAPDDWIIRPTLLPALLYGICTVVFPLFILQPSLGLGLASSKTANPMQARIKSMMTHIIFGIGIWLSMVAMKYLLQIDIY